MTYQRRTITTYTMCAGEHPYSESNIIEPEVAHWHRAEPFHILCDNCYAKLGVVDNSQAAWTPIHQLPMHRDPKTQTGFEPLIGNVGSKSGRGADR